ncbi:uncharacterized protein Dvar_51710 [Desulfosarcina variabilis str. Montpellier]|uniref:hypothetical protein n=1 Tax=Desulfosarcina variabilis TaxID=2300 RepID=UPI003AFABE2C
MDKRCNESLRKAQAAIKSKDFQQAKIILDQIMDEYSEDPKACTYACYYLSYLEDDICIRLNLIDKALKSSSDANFKTINETRKSYIDDAMENAKKNIACGNIPAAKQILLTITEIDKENETALLMFADVVEDNKYKEDILRKVIEINPDNNNAIELLSSLKMTLDDEENLELLIEPINILTSSEDTLIDTDEESSILKKGNLTEDELKKENIVEKKFDKLYWQNYFNNENDVNEKFGGVIERTIELASKYENDLSGEIRSLKFAKKQYDIWDRTKLNNIFLAPAVTNVIKIAEKFLIEGLFYEGFWVTNIYCEMCKILVSRNAKKYQSYHDDLLKKAADIFLKTLLPPIVQDIAEGPSSDLIKIQNEVYNSCVKPALIRRFDQRQRRYNFTKIQPVIKDNILSETAANAFEGTLKYLISNDRPKIRSYANANLPVAFRLQLSPDFAEKRNEWEQILRSTGFGEIVDSLKDSGILVNPEEVGKLSKIELSDIRIASADNRYKDVYTSVLNCANEVKSYLYSEARNKLNYKPPKPPNLGFVKNKDLARQFRAIPRIAKIGNPNDLKNAIEILKNIWLLQIDNLEIQNWMAYLHLQERNLPAAEQILNKLKKSPIKNDNDRSVVLWNLAVLYFEQGSEDRMYEILYPMLNMQIHDEDLFLVVLAFSHKLGEKEKFLNIVPKMRTNQFDPLAFVVAYDLQDENLQKEYVARMLNQSDWILPPAEEPIFDIKDLKDYINKAIIEGQIDALIVWLKARIKISPRYIPNYLELAQVYEKEKDNVDEAFKILQRGVKIVKTNKNSPPRALDNICRDLLELCVRNNSLELGKKAYNIAYKFTVDEDLLKTFNRFKDVDTKNQIEIETNDQEIKNTQTNSFSKQINKSQKISQLPEKYSWVVANFTNMDSATTFLSESRVIKDFCNIIKDMHPVGCEDVIEIIENLTLVVEQFFKTDSMDSRRYFHENATNYERRLIKIVHDTQSVSTSRGLSELLIPYLKVIERVIGDLSKIAGITPNIKIELESSFISLESDTTRVVFRFTNSSDRELKDIDAKISIENDSVILNDSGKVTIQRLAPKASELIPVSISKNYRSINTKESSLNFSAWIKASADGINEIDMGISKLNVPISTFSEAFSSPVIERIFDAGKPLSPERGTLFQGREDVLTRLKNSFVDGVQNARYFLDGIRRVGKTSILNFLPRELPDYVIPVYINFDANQSSLDGGVQSGKVIFDMCNKLKSSCNQRGSQLILPDENEFLSEPEISFSKTIDSLNKVMPGKKPLFMIDEFQDLLYAINRQSDKSIPNTMVLNLFRSQIDENRIFIFFTGSIRFNDLTKIITKKERLFGHLSPLPVSFLSHEGTSNVLRAGFQKWIKIPQETIDTVYEYTGGYPWLVQRYGAELVDLLNDEHRVVPIPGDVITITNESILLNDENFSYWWPTDQLGIDEERFIEKMFRLQSQGEKVLQKEFFQEMRQNDQLVYNRALQNLKSCDVVTSQSNELKIRGKVLGLWLKHQMQTDGRLRIKTHEKNFKKNVVRGKIGMFIDHENFIRSLQRITSKRGKIFPSGSDRVSFLSNVLNRLLEEASRRDLSPDAEYKVSVAFWERPAESALIPAYINCGFNIDRPKETNKIENAVDFKLADVVRQKQVFALQENKTQLDKAIMVTGDKDYVQVIQGLVRDGVNVQIWGAAASTDQTEYIKLLGNENVIALDDICGL